MRLLIVHQAADMYGSDRVCLAIASAAVARGWTVGALVPESGPLVEQLVNVGVDVTILDPLVLRRTDLRATKLWKLPGRWLRAIWRLWQFAKAQRYDVVHSSCSPTLGGAVLARMWRRPHVWHVQEYLPGPYPMRVALEALLQTADGVVVASNAIRDQFTSSALRDRAVVAYSGAAAPDIVPNPVLTAPTATIVCVGRLNAWKGQDVLIRAVRDVIDRGYSVRTYLVGGYYGDESRFDVRLRELIDRHHLGSDVVMLGERSDAQAIVARSDIAVVPSKRPEPFGMTLVEAMHLGRPVISTNAGGPREIIRHGVDGILVPMGDSQALATAIEYLLSHRDEALRLGRSATARAKMFTPAQMTSIVLGLHETCVA